jgi:hypothetical protein
MLTNLSRSSSDVITVISAINIYRCLIVIISNNLSAEIRLPRNNMLMKVRTLTKKVVGLERGPLSLVSTTEDLLDRKVAAPV